MRITEFHQKNNAYIFAGMGLYENHIYFPEDGNRIIVFEGRNGSGKSAITSMLHPFAYNEIDDNRDNSGFILDGKEGYKKIVYDNRIICEHFYKLQSGKRTVKSFLSVDSVQMNPNGNVTTFKELVKKYLGIYANNMTLLRLGSNVTGFLDKSYTERKIYAGQLLKEIEDYIQYSKVVGQKAREVKSILRLTNEKIQRLGVESESKLKSLIDECTDNLICVKNRLDDTHKQLGIVSEKQNEFKRSLSNFSINDINIESCLNRYEYKINDINYRISNVNNSNYNDVSEVEKKLVELTIEIDKIKNETNSTKTIMDFKRSQRGVLYDKIILNEDKLNKISTDFDINDLTKLIEEKESLLKNFDDCIDYKSDATIDDYHLLLGFCQDLEVYYDNIIRKDTTLIKKTVRSIETGNNVYGWIRKELNTVNEQLSYNEFRCNTLNNKVIEKSVYVVYNPFVECNTCDCPYIQYYNDMNNLGTKKTELQKIEKSNAELRHRESIAENIREIADNIQYMKVALNTNKKLISRCKLDNVLSINNVFKCLLNNYSTFYNEKEITSIISKLERYEEYLDTKKDLQSYKEQLKIAKQYKNSINEYKEMISTDKIEMMNIERDLLTMEIEYNDNMEKLNKLIGEEKNTREVILPAISCLDKLNDELNLYMGEKEKILEIDIELKVLESEYDRIKNNQNRLSVEVDQIQNKLNQLIYLKKEYVTFMNDKQRLETEYDELNTVREAVSTEKGLPLYFQQIYLENSRKIMNELLEIVYNGDNSIYIENFSINEKEFRIPYVKNGQFVDDARSASQGERSFISIALSFALMNQKIEKYNIIILDEMDSTLDTENRKLFISMLETQLEMIGSEQCFIISHNEEFDSYPVDIITTRTKSEYVTDKKMRGKSFDTDNLIWYKGIVQ